MADSDLEVKRRSDGSWHPCRVSLSDDNLDIVVQFESCADKDIISDEKDALARLRYRSVPLSSGECLDVEEGDCVLAGHGGQYEGLFFDAIVIKPQRLRHSKRLGCKCLFQIKWLNPEMEENLSSVSSSSIRKLSKKSINSHSVLMAFSNSINPATSANGSPPTDSLLDDTIWGILEKLEETSKSIESSTKSAANNLFEATRGKLSGDALNTVTKHPNNSKISTRCQSKHEVKMKVVRHSEDKPFVSSLAACAALASYFHDLLPNHGIHFSRQGHVNPKNTQDHTLDPASVLLKPDTSCTSGVTDSPIQNILNSPVTCSRHTRSPEKSQSSETQQVSNLSEGGLTSPPVTEYRAVLPPVTDGELKCHTTRSRITRSAVQKQFVDSTEVQDLSKEKHHSLRNNVRITRSVKIKDTSNSGIMLYHGFSKTNESSQMQESEDSSRSETVTECGTNPVTNVKLNSCDVTPRRKRSSERENINLTYEVAQGSSNKTRSDPVNTTRLTRSARRKDANGPSVRRQLGEINLTETLLDKPGEYIATQQKRVKIALLSSSIVGSDNFSTVDEKRSARASTCTTANGEDQGEVEQKAQTPASMKKKAVSLKMPETRFSARLRFLPKTRSQISSPSC